MTAASTTFAGDQLLAIIQRIEGVNEEITERQNDKRDIYAEARGGGFDVKAIKAIVHLRRQDKGEADELQAIIDLYLRGISEAERGTSPALRQANADAGDQLEVAGSATDL
jgi:uncharacterized protein (UPF0335 family)